MARYAYDRLSAQDASFLAAEGPNVPMHVSAIQIFETGPLAEDGGIAIDTIRKAYESVLHLVPRYRQLLRWIPIENRPVWVDDPHFKLENHIRHVALPHPGDLRQLKRVAARIMEYPLDRNRPLWELWVIEGVHDLSGDEHVTGIEGVKADAQGSYFATVAKTHHCMVDGASGVQLAQRLLSATPQITVAEPKPYIPRPIPSDAELLRDQLWRRATLPLRAVRGLQELRDEVDDLRGEVQTRLQALGELTGRAFSRVSDTPLNGPLSPHRRFNWLDMSLDDVKRVRRALDCTVNDVVLGTVTEAVRRYMLSRQVNPERLAFRAATPVSVRSEHEKESLGNRVSMWMVDLPIDEPDPLAQISRLHTATRQLKESRQALGVEMLMSIAEVAPMGLLTLGAQHAGGPMNTIVTNVPGPESALYLLGAKLVAMIPQVPLVDGVGLGIALMSYDGRVFWGFTADYELVPDLHFFVDLIRLAFDDLAQAAGVDLTVPDDEPPKRARLVPPPIDGRAASASNGSVRPS